MQAVLRLGAAYVPIDPLSPESRVRQLLIDAEVSALVTSSSRAKRVLVEELAETPVVLVGDEGSSANWPDLPLESLQTAVEVDADALAFILYTSGSTGKPKGVCISHQNAQAFLAWASSELQPVAADRFASHAPFHFDLSVLDLYLSFSAGASVYLIPERASLAPSELVRVVRDEGITIWYSVPSALVMMASNGGMLESTEQSSLRTILFAGETFPIKHLQRLRRGYPEARLLNLYGPTETNVCTFFEVPSSLEDREVPVPIGSACSGNRVWAATKDGREAQVGEQGELMVDGPTVMLGYWGESSHLGPYATGDIVERVDDDVYSFKGRSDSMVKIRGHRIEPGEIEAALVTHPKVQEAAVAAVGSGIEAQLLGVVVSAGDQSPSVLDLKRHCAERLPHYMIIDRLQLVEALPRTSNGKVDRLALATMVVGPASEATSTPT